MPPVNKSRARQKTQAQSHNIKKSSNSNQRLVFLFVIAVIAVIVAGIFIVYPLLKKTSDTSSVTVIENNQVDATEFETIALDTIAIDIPKVDETKITIKQESSTSVPKGFYIIVGSFRDQANADNLVKNVRKDIELKIYFFEGSGLYRVSAGQYDNIHKAYNDTYSIKDIDGCSGAWVLENL